MRWLLLFFIFLGLEILVAETLVVSTQKEFIHFLKELQKSEKNLRFSIKDKNTSFDAFNDLKSDVSKVAIVRGDILADNMEAKNFFQQSAFTDFKVISKLKDSYSTYLYFISKNKEKDAYKILNPDPKTQKVKQISIGYLYDLSNLYLADIAKSVNSNYRFRYKSFSPKRTLEKLKDGTIDGAFMFVSKDFVNRVKQNGLNVTNIIKPANVKAEKFAQKIAKQKAFNKIGNSIRVDNYLVVSSTISDEQLALLVGALKNDDALITNVKPEFGSVDTRVASISAKIDVAKAQAMAEAKEKEKECKETNTKAKEISDKQATLNVYKKSTLKNIKKILKNIKESDNLASFRPRLKNLLDSVNITAKEANRLVSDMKGYIKECDKANVTSTLVELGIKIGEIKSAKKELAMIESEIIQKQQLDQESIEREQKEQEKEERALQAQLEQEKRLISAQLEQQRQAQIAELEKNKKEVEEGFFTKLKKIITD